MPTLTRSQEVSTVILARHANPLRELRDHLGLSREDFARAIGRGTAAVEKYESELPADWASDLATFADQHGRPDLGDTFRHLAGQPLPMPVVSLDHLTPSEHAYLCGQLSMYRSPASQLEQDTIQLNQSILARRSRS